MFMKRRLFHNIFPLKIAISFVLQLMSAGSKMPETLVKGMRRT